MWINFDDMDDSIYENAFPIMKKYDIPATGFVITGEVGSTDFHNINLSTTKELLEMKSIGLWDFSSHTHNMYSMKKDISILKSKAKQENIGEDINKSTNHIQRELDGNILAIVYPYGQTNKEVVNQLKKSTSIKYGFTLEEQAIVPTDDNYYLPRILVSTDTFNKVVKKWKGFNHE
ncbi:polysaccharide deacetylase family protein [Mammaliicoccus sciuri]|uniref:polysaccharide deacetylase family protein n=1 Tax=Mammaliicoccus sciuri TaxID=1296 RepID=UPI001E38A0BA